MLSLSLFAFFRSCFNVKSCEAQVKNHQPEDNQQCWQPHSLAEQETKTVMPARPLNNPKLLILASIREM